MKKLVKIMLASIMGVCGLTACSSKEVQQQNEKISIVATIFPEYDWVREVLGEKVDDFELTMLLDSGVDLHSFQPTANDVLKISKCDLFIYVGGESDEWVEDVLADALNPDMKVINLLETLGDQAKEEEVIEGMEAEEEEETEEEEEVEYDEHVWLSLQNAKTYVSKIADVIGQLDPENKTVYQENASAYQEKLDELAQQYQKAVKDSTVDTLLFGDRFPFRYLVDDYDLNYYAAFIGCSAETEASFETIKFLSDKVNELDLHSVITLEGSDQKIAKTIVETTDKKNQKIIVLDSMQSVTAKDVEKGDTYLSIMEDNLQALKEALQ